MVLSKILEIKVKNKANPNLTNPTKPKLVNPQMQIQTQNPSKFVIKDIID